MAHHNVPEIQARQLEGRLDILHALTHLLLYCTNRNAKASPIDVVPEGRRPRKDAPTAIPSPEHLGVREGAGYAKLGGWMETKLGSFRVQDRADVVSIIKATTPAALRKVRKQLGKVHATYLRRFDELAAVAKEEEEQERERGGGE